MTKIADDIYVYSLFFRTKTEKNVTKNYENVYVNINKQQKSKGKVNEKKGGNQGGIFQGSRGDRLHKNAGNIYLSPKET